MQRRKWYMVSVLLLLAVFIVGAGISLAPASRPTAARSSNVPSLDRPAGGGAASVAAQPVSAQQTAQQGGSTYRGTVSAVKFDVSPALRSIAPVAPAAGQIGEKDDESIPAVGNGPRDVDTVVQKIKGALNIP